MSAPRPWQEVAHGYDEAAPTYDAQYGDRRSRARHARIDDELLAAVHGARRVLELGVGTGRFLSRSSAPLSIGIDVSSGMLARARMRRLSVVRADAHRLPFAASSFDAVVAAGAVFRYLDPGAALTECARVLPVGGVLAIHQLGARTWSPRRGARPRDRSVNELERADDLDAALAGAFHTTRIVLWRTLRVFPYLVRVPRWLDRTAPVQIWSHAVIVFRRC